MSDTLPIVLSWNRFPPLFQFEFLDPYDFCDACWFPLIVTVSLYIDFDVKGTIIMTSPYRLAFALEKCI